jgi:thiamine pyrophosphate-dependent acetolactate synthase large subunit-like protein
MDPKAIAEAAAIINSAKKPWALVGQGVELGEAQNELMEFLEKLIFPPDAHCSASRLYHQPIRLTKACWVCMVTWDPT